MADGVLDEARRPIVVHGTEVRSDDARRVYREKLARITLDSMVQFVGLLDADGTVLEINKVALDAVGIDLGEVEGKPFWTTCWWQVSPEINKGIRDMIARAASGEFVRWDTEIFGRAGGKETIVIDASLMPVKDDSGVVVFICAEGHDITQKKAQERLIEQQNIELHGLLENGAHDFIVKPFTERDVIARVRSLMRTLKVHEQATHSLEREQAEVELLRTIERIGSSVTSELDIHTIVQTVTDEATRLVGAQFGAFFYNLIDARGESYTLYTLSGVPREAFADFPMPRNTHVFEPTFRGTAVIRSGDITKDERYGKNPPYHGMPKGHLPVRSYLAVPVISHAKDILGGLFFGHAQTDVFTERHERLVIGVAGWAAVAMDNARLHESQLRARSQLEQALASAQEARDEAQRANLAKSQFLAAMSHELRTPLNAIQGHVQQLEMGLYGALNDEQRGTLARVQRSQHALQSLINDVLNFARLEAGRLEYRIESVDAREIVGAVLQMVEPSVAAKGLTTSADVPADLRVAADPDKLRQILLNLLSNAIKFTPSGGHVTVDAPMSDETSGVMVLLRVTDTGRGIPSEKQAEIFEPFVQVHPAQTVSAGGVGLGLAISRDLARGMRGDLRVRSEEGQGASFTLTLPRPPLHQP